MIYRGDYPERTEEEELERQRKLDEAGERKFEEQHEKCESAGGEVMEEILLTPEEWNEAAERGVKKWTDQLDPDNPTSFSSSAPFVYEEVCRAQVRNVAKWMEQEGVVVHERQLGFVLPFQSWAALKAAGGEG